MFTKYVIFSVVHIFLCTVNFSESTLTPKSPKSNKEAKVKPEKLRLGPINQSVIDRSLVAENPSSKDILSNNLAYFKETGQFNIDGLVLGYVTPWNNHGYDVAKLFANKFTHISPAWLQLKRISKKQYEITGTQDVDEKWLSDVKQAGRDRGVKIVPRILFDGWSLEDYNSCFSNHHEIEAAVNAFVTICRKWKFDGLVIEIWSQTAGRIQFDLLVNFVKHIAKNFSRNKLETILVIPPQRGESESMFTPEHYDALYEDVTAFSLMTYDFSSLQRPGPNAPVKWVEDCIKYISPDVNKRDKILTGLNFYGNAYTPNGGKAIVSHEYLSLLKNFKGKMQYDPDSAESYFEVRSPDGRFLVFYPTLHSVNKRVQLANELGTGVSIWELGQGLDYFYDLL